MYAVHPLLVPAIAREQHLDRRRAAEVRAVAKAARRPSPQHPSLAPAPRWRRTGRPAAGAAAVIP
jgi:hypothetical protein